VRLRPPSKTIIAGTLVLATGLAGCGSSSPSSSSSSTAKPSAKSSKSTAAPVPSHPQLHTASGGTLPTTIHLVSSALSGTGALSSGNTCLGGNVPLPVSWSKIPPHTAELVLFVISAAAIHDELGLTRMDWAVAKLSPSLHGISGGKLPAGAILGRNENGQEQYSVCPSKGRTSYYAVLVYALPHRLKLQQGFSALALRAKASSVASAGGVLVAHYQSD
jgi:phosphatidylethanolamine-binding protein (PEBP) family uncharacterized protein